MISNTIDRANEANHPCAPLRRTAACAHTPVCRSAFLRFGAAVFIAMLGIHAAFAQGTDIVVADFEGGNYGNWKVSGTAFGAAPARGTLPGQMTVDGYLGSGLANSFFGGDDSKGSLTSPTFKIERKYIQFLIGGGGWENKTCLNLVLEDKLIRTAAG